MMIKELKKVPKLTESEFRILHSKLIEYYQFIEFRLRGICVDILAERDRDWVDQLSDYDKDALGQLIRKLSEIQIDREKEWFSKEDFEALDNVRKARNYWCHECFGGTENVVTFKKGMVKNPSHAKRLKADYETATEWDDKLADIAGIITKEKDTASHIFVTSKE